MAGRVLRRIGAQELRYVTEFWDFQSLTAAVLGNAGAQGDDTDAAIADLFLAFNDGNAGSSLAPLDLAELGFTPGVGERTTFGPLALDTQAVAGAGDAVLGNYESAVGIHPPPPPPPPPGGGGGGDDGGGGGGVGDGGTGGGPTTGEWILQCRYVNQAVGAVCAWVWVPLGGQIHPPLEP